jgi:hypothetical protein
MSKQLKILNIICVIAALGFLLMIVVTAVTAGDILTTDTLFIMTVCLVMAVMFAASPLLYLKSEGKLPLPGMKKLAAPKAATEQLPAPADDKSPEHAAADTWGAISTHSAAACYAARRRTFCRHEQAVHFNLALARRSDAGGDFFWLTRPCPFISC